MMSPLEGAHGAGADADAAHFALQAAHLDDVAHAHRTLEEQDQPADEVVHHVLQAEPDATRMRRRARSLGQVHPQHPRPTRKPRPG